MSNLLKRWSHFMIRTLLYTHTHMSCLETWLWFGSPIRAAGQQSYRCPPFAGVYSSSRPSFTSCFLGMSHQYHSSSICTCLYSIYICALYQGPLRGELCKKKWGPYCPGCLIFRSRKNSACSRHTLCCPSIGILFCKK